MRAGFPVEGRLPVEYPRTMQVGIFGNSPQKSTAVPPCGVNQQYDFPNICHDYSLRALQRLFKHFRIPGNFIRPDFQNPAIGRVRLVR